MIAATDPRLAYTIANWTVRPGAEDAFVKEWTQFSEWLLEHRGAESFALLKATGGARQFVSVAVWSGRGAGVPWATFLERLSKCRAFCERSDSRTYRPMALLNRATRREADELAA